MMIRIILNGKKAGLNEVRSAISILRQESSGIEVRVTWEHGDGERLVKEASQEGIQRIVAAGGDGTLNEIVNGIAKLESNKRPELAILPLGTANDFATSCNIPLDPLGALRLAVYGTTRAVDIVRANDRYFINVASGGFWAQVSADTPAQLKNVLGGGAYALSAVVKSLTFIYNQGRLLAEGIELEGSTVMGAVCNGRQAGGGKILAPDAYINDGLLDVMIIFAFPVTELTQVIQEVLDPSFPGKYIKRFRTKWIEAWPQETRSINLDGEPFLVDHIRFDVLPAEIQLVLPKDCPCIRR
ncbi:MAG: lipid kinase YegS [Thermodesulfobacteriota bacterium]|nr:lipid kinase YegS [Thermodesulfobacteriota bacterium]